MYFARLRRVGDDAGPRGVAGRVDVALPDRADRGGAQHPTSAPHRGRRGARRRPPRRARRCATPATGETGISRHRVVVRLHRGRAAHRLAGRHGRSATTTASSSPAPTCWSTGSDRPAGRSTATRTTWRPASPGCSSPATCAPSRSSGSPPPSARAPWPSCSSTATWRSGERPASRRSTTIPDCSPDELRTLFLFEKLDDEQLDWLCERGHVELRRAGPGLPRGRPADLLLRAARGLARRCPGGSAPTTSRSTRTSQRGVYAGAGRPTWATGCRRPTIARPG